MRITKVLDCVYEQVVGWNPSSGSIKPVHIANGLFRDLTKQYYDTSELIEFAVPGRKGKEPIPSRSFESIVLNVDPKRFPRFADFADQSRKHDFEKLREAVRGVIAADGGGAVMPEAATSSMTLSTPQMISADYNDRKVGRFMAAFLRGPDPENPGNLSQVVERALVEGLDSPRDDISFLVWPLLSQEPSPVKKDNFKIPIFTKRQYQPFVKHLDCAAAQLAEHELKQGNRLATFRRAVEFTCLGLIAYVQAMSSNGKMDQRIPLLLAMDAAKGTRLANASEQTILKLIQEFEGWLASELATRLERGLPLTEGSDDKEKPPKQQPPTPDHLHRGTVRAWLREFTSKDGDRPDAETLAHRLEIYDEAKAVCGTEKTYDVLGETLVRCYIDEYESGGPSEFLRGLATRAGLFFPYGAGRSREKRVRASVHILDVIVKACTPVSGSIPFEAFLDRIWERFGLIAGGRVGTHPTDLELLQSIGIDISPTDLHENSLSLVDHLVDIGLARRYPDNVAYVGKYHA